MQNQQKTASTQLRDRGLRAFESGDIKEARTCLSAALNANPNDAMSMFHYGTLEMHQGNYGAGLAILLQSSEGFNGNSHEVYNNIGNCLRGCGRDEAAEIAWNKSLEILERKGVKDPDVLNNMGTCCINSGRPADAERWCREVLEINPKHQQANWNLCLALLEQGRFKEGWEQHDWGYFAGTRKNRQYDCGVWKGEEVERLVLFGEQGVGDELLFASMVSEAKARCKELIIDCHPRLEETFRRSFEPTAIYPTRKEPGTDWIYRHYPISAKCSMGDLGRVFRNELSDFDAVGPYLTTDPAVDRALRQRIVEAVGVNLKAPRIGIAWSGGTVKTHCFNRTPHFAHFVDLVKGAPGAQWFSLHYPKDAQQQLQEADLPEVHHWQEVIDDLDSLTSLAGQMDYVVTVDQTLVHQCGAIGQQAFVLVPHGCSWRYPVEVEGQDTSGRLIWYGDHIELLRQPKRHGQGEDPWGPVFAELKDRIGARI